MHWACLYIHSSIYVLLAANVVAKLPFYDGIAFVSYLVLAVVSYLMHRPHS